MDVTVQVADLREILIANRAKHKGEFEVAFERYRDAAILWFEERLSVLEKGEAPDTWFRLPLPEDHTDDYDRMIHMLDMHTEKTIGLSGHEYQNYVDDQWPWTPSTTASNQFYGVS